MKTKLKTSAKDIFNILSNDDLYADAAQLAYSLIMAIIPLIMFLITLAGKLTLPVDSVYSYLEFLLPSQAFQAVDSILQEILNSSNFSLVTLVSTIYFISVGTRGMMRVTNKAFHTVERRAGWKFFLTSLVFAVLLVFVLLLTLGAVVFGQVILNTLDTWFTDLFQMNMWVISSSIRYLITFVLLGLLFSLIYAAAPNLKLCFKDVYIGAYLSAFVWILGSAVFAYYINHFSHYGLLFGSLGGIFILLAWLYFTSLVLLIGIYFNATLYYRKHK